MNTVLQVTKELCQFLGITNLLENDFGRAGKSTGLRAGYRDINLVM